MSKRILRATTNGYAINYKAEYQESATIIGIKELCFTYLESRLDKIADIPISTLELHKEFLHDTVNKYTKLRISLCENSVYKDKHIYQTVETGMYIDDITLSLSLISTSEEKNIDLLYKEIYNIEEACGFCFGILDLIIEDLEG